MIVVWEGEILARAWGSGSFVCVVEKDLTSINRIVLIGNG